MQSRSSAPFNDHVPCIFLLMGHPAPFGTLAFGSLFLAGVLQERQASRVSSRGLGHSSRPALTE